MKAAVGAGLVGLLGTAQIGVAAAVSAVIAKYLDGSYLVDSTSQLTTSCALSMKSASACTAGYVSTAMSILFSLMLIGMQCSALDASPGASFCGPVISALGFFWWCSYGAAATSASNSAEKWDTSMSTYRTAVCALSWSAMALFLLSFFVSAAAASASARARAASFKTGLEREESLARTLSNGKRFSQPTSSPPASPSKVHRSSSGAYGAYEPFQAATSPKKWVQPTTSRSRLVTSDGTHTLLLINGMAAPVPLSSPTLGSGTLQSPDFSPHHSPLHSPAHSPARSPLHRSSTAGGSGNAGTFTNVVLSSPDNR